MKSNFAALLVLFITGCGSDAVDATSTKIDETGGVAGASTTEFGGDTSTTPGGSSSTTTTTIPGGSSSTTTTTTVAGSGQGGQGTQATGGSSQPGSGGSVPASGGAVQASGGSSPQATGGNTTQATGGSTPATGGKAGEGSGGSSSVGGRSNIGGATGGRSNAAGGTSTGLACNPNNPSAICSVFQTCDATRHCAGPVRNTAIDCSDVSVDGWKSFGYSYSSAPDTSFNTHARCQLAPTASTDPSVQNYCCNFTKNSCMVAWADFPPACPTTGATAGKPYLYDCLNPSTPPAGCVVAVKNSEYTPVGTGYCCATQTVE